MDHILCVGFLRLWKQRRIVFFWDCAPSPLQRTTMASEVTWMGQIFRHPLVGESIKTSILFPFTTTNFVLDFPLPSLELPVVDNYFQKLDGEPIGLLKSPLGIFTCTQNKIFYHKSSSSNIEKVSSSNLVQYLKKKQKKIF